MSLQLEQVILFLIDQTSKKSKRHAQRFFDERNMNITADQWVLLKIIEENEGSSQKILANKTYRDTASITRTLDLLEKKGYIQRRTMLGNRRQYEVYLTAFGKSFIAKHMDLVSELRVESLAGLSEEDIQNLKRILLRMQENFE